MLEHNVHVSRNTCLKHEIADGWTCTMPQCYASYQVGHWWNSCDHCCGHIVPERVPTSWPFFCKGLKFWTSASYATKEGSVCHVTLLLSTLTGLPGGKQVASHTAFQNEDNHKPRQRCQCLADGGFINVSSMNWSGVLSVGHWDKTAQVTRHPNTADC